MKLTLCLLALLSLATSQPQYGQPSMSRRCSRTMKNFFLITCAKEIEESQLMDLQQKSFFGKLISLVRECCKHAQHTSWCSIAASSKLTNTQLLYCLIVNK